MGEFGYVIF